VLDWCRAGLDEALCTLHAAGLRTAGTGSNEAAAWAPLEWAAPDGARVRLLACATESSGVPDDWAAQATRSGIALLPDLSDASAQRFADAMAGPAGERACRIVSIHWGSNWVARVPDAQRRFARRLIDLGAADLVHGHSSHHPLPIEVHRDRAILHGCGDLINDYEGIGSQARKRRSDVGCLYAATLDAASGRLVALAIVPLQVRRFRLGESDAAARRWALGQFNDSATPWGARGEHGRRCLAAAMAARRLTSVGGPADGAHCRHAQRWSHRCGDRAALGDLAIEPRAQHVGQPGQRRHAGRQQVVEGQQADQQALGVANEQAAHAVRMHPHHRFGQVGFLGHTRQVTPREATHAHLRHVTAARQHLDRQVAVGDHPRDARARPLLARLNDHQRADMVLAHQRGCALQRLADIDGDDGTLADRSDVHSTTPRQCNRCWTAPGSAC
jgi:hypothetical protein